MVYRAVLGNADFSGHLAGATGIGKSQLAAIAQQHFGPDLDAQNLPGSWSSTPNSLELLAFAAKDTVMVVDDFAPEGSNNDITRQHNTFARLARAKGNSSARGRMRADGTLRPDKPPRGFVISTGEEIPKGHSIKARLVILELERGMVCWDRLTKAQGLASKGVYAAAMAAFIQWLLLDYEGRTTTFRADHIRHRDQLQLGGHKRTVDAGAQLLATYQTLLTFARETGALSEAERVALWRRAEAGILAALEPQASYQTQSDPVARFGELLTGLFTSGRAHVADAKTGDHPGDGWGWEQFEVTTQYGPEERYRAKGALIGWVDGDDLYLEPQATYAELQRFARDQGDTVPVTDHTLWKRLSERGHIVTREHPHMTTKRTFAGAGRVRALHLRASYVEESGASGASGAKEKESPSGTVVDVPHLLNIASSEVGQQQEVGQQRSTPVTPGNHTGKDAQHGISHLIGTHEGVL